MFAGPPIEFAHFCLSGRCENQWKIILKANGNLLQHLYPKKIQKYLQKPSQEASKILQNGVSRTRKIDFQYESSQDDLWARDEPKMLPKFSQLNPKMAPKWCHEDNHDLIITSFMTIPWSSWYDSHQLIIRVWRSWDDHHDMIKKRLNRKPFIPQDPDRLRRSYSDHFWASLGTWIK